MAVLFEIIKVAFFALTILIGVVYTGTGWIDPSFMESVKVGLMPGYLVLAGLTIGYIVGHLLSLRHEGYHRSSWIRGFVLGLVIGFILAIIYVVA